MLNISPWLWAATLVALMAVLGFDLLIIGRRPHEPSLRESSLWVLFYVTLAVAFGIGVTVLAGPRFGGEFFAGWLTEYSLSVDNLFVFVIIMARFSVPREDQQKALTIGIVLALIMRGVFIALGAAAINRFIWIFYLFGIFLLYTAFKLAHDGEEEEFKENKLITLTRRIVPITSDFSGGAIRVHRAGRVVFTPMLIVMIAIGTTDLLFALDSIPAVFGLTKEAYLVFTVNVFALLGLRQLYFLLGGLLKRLVYLSIGLAIILAFIGVKLIFEAMHGNNVAFINGGNPISWAPEIPIWLSLLIIVGSLAITAAASLLKTQGNPSQHETPRGDN